jgi:hypothetical protein
MLHNPARRPGLRRLLPLVLLALSLVQVAPPVRAQTAATAPTPTSAPTPTPTPDCDNTAACPRPDLENGILVGQTKLYDERSFRTMLQTLEENLSGLRLLNQAALVGGAGRIQGARLNTSSFGLTVSTPPIPGVTTTLNTGATTTSNVVTTESATPSTVTTSNVVSPDTTQQVITAAAITPAPAAAPAQTSGFTYPDPGVSSQDLLAEQMALQYQVMDLRLLLERSLTDRVGMSAPRAGQNVTYWQRDSAIAGFQISLDPGKQYEGAVAEIEIVVDAQSKPGIQADPAREPEQPRQQASPGQQPGPSQTPPTPTPTPTPTPSPKAEPPSLVMLLPRDKTYNVAAATKDAKSIGVGALLQVVNVGVSGGKTSETLYIVGDTDTVAFERRAPRSDGGIKVPGSAVTFGWQFRPVLGRKSVAPGLRQVYALLALPRADSGNVTFNGTVRAYTRWRRFDAKTKTVKEVIRGSESYRDLDHLTVTYRADNMLSPLVSSLDWEDVGNGQVIVRAGGRNYLDGIKVLAGNKLVGTAEDGLSVQGDSNFVLLMSAQSLAQRDPLLIGRYGDPKPLRSYLPPGVGTCLPAPSPDAKTCPPGMGLRIVSAEATPINAQNSKVVLTLKARNAGAAGSLAEPVAFYHYNTDANNEHSYVKKELRPVVTVGGKVFGLSDAPLVSESAEAGQKKYSFVAPTQLLRDARKLTVRELLHVDSYTDEAVIDLKGSFRPSLVSVMYANGDKTQLAIMGGKFDPCKKITVLLGPGTPFERPATTCAAGAAPPAADTKGDLRLIGPELLTLSAEQSSLKGAKQLIVMQDGAEPVVLALSAPPDVPEPVVDKQESLPQGHVKTIKLTGSNFGSVADATFEGKTLSPKASEDGKTLELTVTSELTATAGDKQVNLVLKNGKVKPHTLQVAPGR